MVLEGEVRITGKIKIQQWFRTSTQSSDYNVETTAMSSRRYPRSARRGGSGCSVSSS